MSVCQEKVTTDMVVKKDAPMPGERFFSRWSQRKRKQSSETTQKHLPEALSGSVTPVANAGGTLEENGELPPIESLEEGSDYSEFLSPKVAEELQRLALRKLFSSASFNVRDGLDDYDEDYRLFESLGETITAEMRHRMERTLDDRFSEDGQEDPKSPPTGLDDEDALVHHRAPLPDEGDEKT